MKTCKQALQEIVKYVLPYYEINGKKYVELEYAEQLKTFAKDALNDVPRSS